MTDSKEDGLYAFAHQVIEWAGDGHDPDGSEIQDLAVKHGLLVKVGYDPERHTLPDWLDGEVQPGDDYFEFAPAMLSASSPPVGGSGEVAVKALEWVGAVPHVWNAYSAVGAHYQIVQHGGDIWWVRLNGTALALGKSYASLEAAKAAAQADYETRIRSALAASPVTHEGLSGGDAK